MEVDALLKKTKANRNFYRRLIFLEKSFINLKCDLASAPLAVRGVYSKED